MFLTLLSGALAISETDTLLRMTSLLEELEGLDEDERDYDWEDSEARAVEDFESELDVHENLMREARASSIAGPEWEFVRGKCAGEHTVNEAEGPDWFELSKYWCNTEPTCQGFMYNPRSDDYLKFQRARFCMSTTNWNSLQQVTGWFSYKKPDGSSNIVPYRYAKTYGSACFNEPKYNSPWFGNTGMPAANPPGVGDSLTECAERCTAESRCHGFSWSPRYRGSCYMAPSGAALKTPCISPAGTKFEAFTKTAAKKCKKVVLSKVKRKGSTTPVTGQGVQPKQIYVDQINNCEGSTERTWEHTSSKSQEISTETSITLDNSWSSTMGYEMEQSIEVATTFETGAWGLGVAVEAGGSVTQASSWESSVESTQSKANGRSKTVFEGRDNTQAGSVPENEWHEMYLEYQSQMSDMDFEAEAECKDKSGTTIGTKKITGTWRGVAIISSSAKTKDKTSDCPHLANCECADVTGPRNEGRVCSTQPSPTDRRRPEAEIRRRSYQSADRISGTCGSIMTDQECRNWASARGVPFDAFKSSSAPRGCYQYYAWNRNNLKVYYNANGNKQCTKWRRCVCKNEAPSVLAPPSQQEGSCSLIMTDQECRNWAATNSFSFNSYKSSSAPRGCYQYHAPNGNNLKVFYNANGSQQCTGNRRCICPAERKLAAPAERKSGAWCYVYKDGACKDQLPMTYYKVDHEAAQLTFDEFKDTYARSTEPCQ